LVRDVSRTNLFLAAQALVRAGAAIARAWCWTTTALLAQQPALERVWLRGSLLRFLSTLDKTRGLGVYLLSDTNSFMTGADIFVDGGYTTT
jgi:enoyl-[acyl-carrier-protein] reductase (NADH)